MVLPTKATKLHVQALDVEKGMQKHSPSPDSPSKRKRAPTVEDIRAGEALLGNSEPVVGSQPARGGRFKALGNLVLAMKRFQVALNPPVDFARRPAEEPSSSTASPASQGRIKAARSPPVQPPVVTAPDAKRVKTNVKPQQHGNKASYLFKPLPAVE